MAKDLVAHTVIFPHPEYGEQNAFEDISAPMDAKIMVLLAERDQAADMAFMVGDELRILDELHLPHAIATLRRERVQELNCCCDGVHSVEVTRRGEQVTVVVPIGVCISFDASGDVLAQYGPRLGHRYREALVNIVPDLIAVPDEVGVLTQ